MGTGWRTKLLALLTCSLCPGGASTQTVVEERWSERAGDPRPNILLIVADDLGYSDLGAFGGEINTPNLDRLARHGVQLTNMHVAPTCSPTRAMLLTGVDSHRVGLGAMAEVPSPVRSPGYQGSLLNSASTAAECLSDIGYGTVMAGKWHLGKAPSQWPHARGFRRSFALLDGAANHFGFDQEAIWDKTVLTATYVEDDRKTRFPNGAYSTEYFADRLIDYVKEIPDEQPIFGYLAFTAPHWPLQARPGEIAKYKGRYDGGPQRLRAQRLARMKAAGFLDESTVPAFFEDRSGWDALPPEEKAAASRKMEIYAAMVEGVDTAIGRVLASLETDGRLRNTIVIFLSDNGPDGADDASILRMIQAGDGTSFGIDRSFGALGSGTSFTAYGPEWAQVSSTPFRLFKGYPTEGGTRVPAIVSGPGVVPGTRRALVHATDLLPTLMDLAGAGAGSESCRAGMLRPTGYSLMPVLRGTDHRVRPPQEGLGMEFYGSAALWSGNWKLLRMPKTTAATPLGEVSPQWRLFDVARDPGETMDLARKMPRRVKRMRRNWKAYVDLNSVVEVNRPSAALN